MFILSRAWHVELEALSVEDLVVVESWRCLIEANVLAREHFVVSGPTFRCPLSPGIFEVILNFISSFAQLLRASKHFLGVCLVEGAHFTLNLWSIFPAGSLRVADAD